MSDAVRSTLLGLAAVLALALGLTQVNPAVRYAEASVERVAVAAGSVYVSLRVINAALSTAQEIEIGATFGAQASAQPLKVLEPVDDTVERVADVVFAVAAGAAVASVGLGPVAALGAMVLAAGLAGLAFATSVPSMPAAVRRMAERALRLGAALAVVLPLVVGLGQAVGERMTAPIAAEAEAELDRITGEAELLIGGGPVPPAADGAGTAQGVFDRLTGALNALSDYRAAAGVFFTQADVLFGAAMTLIAVFALQTLVLPILLFWTAVTVLRRSMD